MPSYDRLSAQDRSFLDLESPETHMHVAGVFLFEGEALRGPEGGVDIDRLRDYIASRLHQIPRYRQRLARIPIEQHPIWIDDDRFNLHYHIRHTALPPPGDDRQLKRLCGRIVSQQLDRGKPLWEIWVVEGLESDRVALVTKTHHCMIDGVSGADLLQVLLEPTTEREFERAAPWLPQKPPGSALLLRDSLLRRFEAPIELARTLRSYAAEPDEAGNGLRDAVEWLRDNALRALHPASPTPFNAEIGPHRRFDWLALDLDLPRSIKRALGGTLNDVVLAAVAGAVRRFLEQRGFSQSRLADLDFRSFCPVSVRADSERGALGNRVASMIAALPVGERDPLKRLRAVSRVMGDLKQSRQALGADVLTSVSEWTAPTLVSIAMRLAFKQRASNLVVTNVPGPQIPLYLLGARMSEAFPVVPLFEGQGLGIALFSYAGGLYFGFNADWDLFPDLHEFVRALADAFGELAGCCAEAKAQVATP
jgi:WS/DGAT/MGAT family acyltransferase